MSSQDEFGGELAVLRHAASSCFSRSVLVWQLGGTMLAAFFFAAASSLGTYWGRAVEFFLTSVGFTAAYVILSATGAMVGRIMESGGAGKDRTGVAPLHFLVDNLSTALLLPLIIAVMTVLLAAVACIPVTLWRSSTGQTVLVIPSALFFALAAVVVTTVVVLLFFVPAMVAVQRRSMDDATRLVATLFWRGKMAVVRYYGAGMAVALVLVAPMALIALLTRAACGWVYDIACPDAVPPDGFVRFVLHLYEFALFVAPVATVPLAFMNGVAVAAYEDLLERLEGEEAEAHEETPTGGEETPVDEIDLEVEGEEGTGPPPLPSTGPT